MFVIISFFYERSVLYLLNARFFLTFSLLHGEYTIAYIALDETGIKNTLYFYSPRNYMLWVLIRSFVICTHNIFFGGEIRKNTHTKKQEKKTKKQKKKTKKKTTTKKQKQQQQQQQKTTTKKQICLVDRYLIYWLSYVVYISHRCVDIMTECMN